MLEQILGFTMYTKVYIKTIKMKLIITIGNNVGYTNSVIQDVIRAKINGNIYYEIYHNINSVISSTVRPIVITNFKP